MVVDPNWGVETRPARTDTAGKNAKYVEKTRVVCAQPAVGLRGVFGGIACADPMF